MNYQGSYRKLLANAKAAMLAAIEIYNKPTALYREECAVILMLNAWELALKAILSKKKQSIYYPKKQNQPYRTLSWRDALQKAKPYFPSKIGYLPVEKNLDMLGIYRDDAIHFYNDADIATLFYGIAQASVKNLKDIVKHVFNENIMEQVTWSILPIGTNPPIDLISYLSEPTGKDISEPAKQFLSKLTKANRRVVNSNNDSGRLMTAFKVQLVSVKNERDADARVKVLGGEEKGGSSVVHKTLDPNVTHPLRQCEVIKKIKKSHDRNFTSYTCQAVAWKYDIKSKSQYCWQAQKGGLILYSYDFVTWLKQLTKNDIEVARKEYRDHLRKSKRKHK